MAKVDFYTIDKAEKEAVFNAVAAEKRMTPFAVEKDWWVVQTLGIVFEMKMSQYLLFKGGTSLSKAWRLIERFSEDVDLAIDRELFGFSGDLNKNQRDKLRKVAGSYVDNEFFSELKAAFHEKGFSEVNLVLEEGEESDRDRKINIYYPNVIASTGYMEPRVQIEIGSRSLRDPFTYQTFGSLLDEVYPQENFAKLPIVVPTVNPERTFLEKIFLLHEEFQRPAYKMRVDRLSRHLYDVVKLSKTEFAQKALEDPDLYETIVHHRQTFTRIGGVNYNLHQPKTINPLPVPEIMGAWKSDYNIMVEQMIYETDPLSFEQLMFEMSALKERINALPWEFRTKFPSPGL